MYIWVTVQSVTKKTNYLIYKSQLIEDKNKNKLYNNNNTFNKDKQYCDD